MWREMFDFSPDAVLMVLASELYDESDYVRDYDKFLEKLYAYYDLLEGYGIDTASLKQAEPGFIRKNGNLIWWERRKLCWGGLSNIVTNAKLKHQYSQKEKLR